MRVYSSDMNAGGLAINLTLNRDANMREITKSYF